MPPSFDELFREYYPRLLARCRRWRLGRIAEDIAQETLLRAWVRLDELGRVLSIWGWLQTTAYRIMVDWLRVEARQGRLLTAAATLPDRTPTIEEVEERGVLSQATRCLPERQAAALALVYDQGRDREEAAALMCLSRSAFKQLLHRARRGLVTQYRQLDDTTSASIDRGLDPQ